MTDKSNNVTSFTKKRDLKKAKEILGWNPRPAEESIIDIANQMKDLGMLK